MPCYVRTKFYLVGGGFVSAFSDRGGHKPFQTLFIKRSDVENFSAFGRFCV